MATFVPAEIGPIDTYKLMTGFEKLDALGRLAGNYYSTTRDRFDISRP